MQESMSELAMIDLVLVLIGWQSGARCQVNRLEWYSVEAKQMVITFDNQVKTAF